MYKPYLYAFGQYIVEISNIIPILMSFRYTASMDTEQNNAISTHSDDYDSAFSSSYELCTLQQQTSANVTADSLDPGLEKMEVNLLNGIFT